jgi:PAS domain S-box-containing protein
MTHNLDFESNNDFFKLLFQSIEEGLVIVNDNGEIVYVNLRTQELFCYSSEELLGKKIEILIPKKHHNQHPNHVKGYSQKPTKKRMGTGRVLEAQTKFGTTFYTEISLNHIEIENKKYFVALITDVSKRVDAENKIKELNTELEEKVQIRTLELEHSKYLYTAVARNFPNGTINVFDKNLNYIFAEGRELYKHGITSTKLIGTSYIKRLPKEIQPTINKEFKKVFLGKKTDFDIKLNDQFYHINAVPLRNDNNEIDKILMVEANVTTQKNISHKLEQSLIKEKEINEMKSRFISMASHEFRTPLSTILSSVSLIKSYLDNDKPENTEKHIKRIKNSVKGLTEILDDFLSTDKLESNSIKINKSVFNYSNFVSEITEDLQTICKDNQIIVSKINTENTTIFTDSNILKNIIYNLISNAIKYSHEGQVIECNSFIENSVLTIHIQDFGIGIPLDDQEELFSRFFRAKNVINIKGTGLGLNIVKRYLSLLNGNIKFESQENVGTKFTVKVPLKNE